MTKEHKHAGHHVVSGGFVASPPFHPEAPPAPPLVNFLRRESPKPYPRYTGSGIGGKSSRRGTGVVWVACGDPTEIVAVASSLQHSPLGCLITA